MAAFKIAVLQCARGRRLEAHSYHFAPFMDDCDATVLREVYPAIYYWFTNGHYPHELFYIEKTPGFEITTVWDVQGIERARPFSRFVCRHPKPCDTLDEAIDAVDAVFLADGGGEGDEHLSWIGPILRKRLPVFVDKPLAATYADARTMIDLANEYDVPLMTASILAHVDEIEHFRHQWVRIPSPGLAVIKGVGPSNGAVIHGLGLMHGLFGTGVEWVESMGDLPCEILNIRYTNGLQVVMLNTPYDTFDWFSCEVWGRTKRRNPPPLMYARSNNIGDPEYLSGTASIVRLFKRMLETRQPPIPYETPLEAMAMLDGARRAHQIRQRIRLCDICAPVTCG